MPSQGDFKTHCVRGHSLIDAYITDHRVNGKWYPMRICRVCQLQRMKIQDLRERHG